MTEIDPLAPQVVTADVEFVPPAPRTPSRLAPGKPVPWRIAVAMLALLATVVGVGVALAAILGGSAEPLGLSIVSALVTCHILLSPRHRWWAALAGAVGFAAGTIPFGMLLPEAYALNCAIAVATIVYVLVTHLPQRRRPAD
jgi:hypothetical protein